MSLFCDAKRLREMAVEALAEAERLEQATLLAAHPDREKPPSDRV
jgi:hypothetical protein